MFSALSVDWSMTSAVALLATCATVVRWRTLSLTPGLCPTPVAPLVGSASNQSVATAVCFFAIQVWTPVNFGFSFKKLNNLMSIKYFIVFICKYFGIKLGSIFLFTTFCAQNHAKI